MKPIIFLDVDGVLNRYDTKERLGPYFGLDVRLVKRAQRLIADVDAEVVLSSTWRLHAELRSVVVARIPVIGLTPEIPNGSRGAEIAEWLGSHVNPEGGWRKHVVIDDDRDMVPGLTCFFTNPEFGLTEEVAERVRRYFA